ncbi:ClbS/DfsB family four-helix bundle protein [Bacteroides pyogenes]|uniref:ClbS/DfsB family four-helix bundle protein n=1 Tax=Bacteroides pyogenes TaxID=310300 RepID=UPI002FD9C23F
MARATTKTDLIIAANGQFDRLCKIIEQMSDELQNAAFAHEMAAVGKETHWSRDKNLRDVLVHLHEWHKLLLNWIESNRAGDAKPFLPEPYNWKTYPAMNVEFWEKHQKTSLIDAKNMLMESHKKVMALIETFSNDELFAKNTFAWTGTSTLGAYCVSATSSHYDWAMKKLKLHIKTSGK